MIKKVEGGISESVNYYNKMIIKDYEENYPEPSIWSIYGLKKNPFTTNLTLSA